MIKLSITPSGKRSSSILFLFLPYRKIMHGILLRMMLSHLLYFSHITRWNPRVTVGVYYDNNKYVYNNISLHNLIWFMII